jgi:hypothetical protein
MTELTSFFVIDAKTMETVQEYPLPFKLSQGFHSNYFNKHDLVKESKIQQKAKQALFLQ